MAVAERELNVHVGVTLDQWIADNDGLIKSVAGEYFWRFCKVIAPYDFDDLYQIAAQAVVESYEKFVKMNDNVDFKKYVVSTMHFRVERFITFRSRAIHVPLLKRSKVKLKVLSFNAKAKDGDGDELENFLLRATTFSIDDMNVREFINTLDPLKMKILLLKMDMHTNKRIASEVGMSNVTVSKVLKSIIPLWQAWEKGCDPIPDSKSIEYRKKWLAIARERGINVHTFKTRVASGMSHEEAATTNLRRGAGV